MLFRSPFNVNQLALHAANLALGKDDFLEKSVTLVRLGRTQLADGFSRLGLRYLPSEGNFICFFIPDKAELIYQAMLKKGIIIRHLKSFGMPDACRVSVGTAEDNVLFLSCLETCLKEVEL